MALALNILAYIVILIAAALRLNAMHWRGASVLEGVLWWALGLSAFAGVFVIEREPSAVQVCLALSGAGLLVHYTQAIWRPWFANRRCGARRGPQERGAHVSFHPLDDH